MSDDLRAALEAEQDGTCQRCAGEGCVACDARKLPPGWKVVPVEPTQEMLDAAWRAMQGNISAGVTWAAMLAAAPEVPR